MKEHRLITILILLNLLMIPILIGAVVITPNCDSTKYQSVCKEINNGKH